MAGHRTLLSILLDRDLWSGSLPWTLLALGVANVCVAAWSKELAAERAANMLVSRPSMSADGRSPRVRYDWSAGEELGEYLRHVPDATLNPLVVLVGMSQMYAINDQTPGDQTISEWLDDALEPEGIRVFGLAAPNMHNEEALLYLLATLEDPRTRPSVFLYGVCFDKFRNGDLRPKLLELLRARPRLQARWREVCTAERKARFPTACEKMSATLRGLSESSGSSQRGRNEPTLEERLRERLGLRLPVIGERFELNAHAQQTAYLTRNALFGIHNDTKRPIVAGLYDRNRELLELLIDVAQQYGIGLGLYVIPLNPLGSNPYMPEQYSAFKTWLEQLAQRHGVAFANLERNVPSSDWGFLRGEPDFKHFKGEGHKRTAQALLEHFGPYIRGRAQERAAR